MLNLTSAALKNFLALDPCDMHGCATRWAVSSRPECAPPDRAVPPPPASRQRCREPGFHPASSGQSSPMTGLFAQRNQDLAGWLPEWYRAAPRPVLRHRLMRRSSARTARRTIRPTRPLPQHRFLPSDPSHPAPSRSPLPFRQNTPAGGMLHLPHFPPRQTTMSSRWISAARPA